jgi:hypothetical protein
VSNESTGAVFTSLSKPKETDTANREIIAQINSAFLISSSLLIPKAQSCLINCHTRNKISGISAILLQKTGI